MRLRLAYGRDGLWLDLPDRNVTVVEPRHVPGLPDQRKALRSSLRQPIGAAPLRDSVGDDDTVAIVFSDITRAQPRQPMLTALLEELAHVPPEQIVLINALGTHRPNTSEELEGMLGSEILSGFRVVQHDAWDSSGLVPVGTTSFGHQVHLNAEYVRATGKILTGFIEPHFFAGFSGGPKAVLPGVAAERSILENHGAEMIAHPLATWGVTDGNPIWEEMREAALMCGPTFLFNVSLNRDKQVTGVFAGDLLQAHGAGAAFVRSTSMAPVAERFDIVITSNSGYPLDLNLYQAVKGMSAAAQVVKPGGSIIVAAECWDGVPEHGEYGELLRAASTAQELLAMVQSPGFFRQDQWQVQIQAQIELKADVYVKTSYLDQETLEQALLCPCSSVEDTLADLLQRYGPDATICVLPEGPMTIPHVASQQAAGKSAHLHARCV
jgi:nickel-dependent lactate racemase